MAPSPMKTKRGKRKAAANGAPGSSSNHCLPNREDLLARAHAWEEKLLGGPITFFPVRHHSLACAKHLARWIEAVRPEAIIVEGPRSLDKWITPLASDDCVGPVAILTTYRESDAPMAPRHSAYFPLCDYSPEWVALRQGAAIGARVRFADLEFEDKVRIRLEMGGDQDAPRTMLGVLLADESHLRHSRFIAELTRRMGCRDFDELWDHLFESRADHLTAGRLVGLLATYCDLSRASYDAEYLKSDGTLAREAVMVEVIREEYKRLNAPQRKGSLLVVAGGFHTVALADAVKTKGNSHKAKLPKLDPKLVGSWLIRYSYDQLDALSGYRSGMPSPGFYDALWRAEQEGASKRAAVARLVSTIARQTRGKPIPHEASVTDSIAAVQMLDRLADLRGHHTPTRSDVLDAIASCMRKESLAGADPLTAIVNRTLAGDRIGSVPASAGQPPIIDDFQRMATRYRLPADTIEPRGVTLELYRKPQHRPVSFLLHQLALLDVSYASFVDGPDFINGHHLGKLREQWQAAWNPCTEARLAELASLGDTVDGAAATRMMQLVEALEEEGAARSADAAVDLLIRACRCGLHAHAWQLVRIVEDHIAEDGVFASLARGLSRLILLLSAREPLEARRLTQLPDVITLCYQRATHVIDTLAAAPDDQLDASLDGLLSMRELLSGDQESEGGNDEGGNDESTTENSPPLDKELFVAALKRLISDTGTPPRSEIAGAAAGLLHGLGEIDQQHVCSVVRRYLDAAVEDIGGACGVVRGLMMAARETFRRSDELLLSIDGLFQQWEEARFVNALPHLRLAFSQLSPKEVDSVATRVAALHKVEDIGPLVNPDITEDDMRAAVQATELMNRSLAEDGLA